MRLFLLGLALPLLAQAPRFTVRDAIQAEWKRQPPAFDDAQKAALPAADRARLELTLARIGAPGAPALLPPELDHPTPEAWEAKAQVARTPRERFDALFFLNRFKRPDALKALDGLTSKDAASWPADLHLEAQIATARINGGIVTPALQAFLDALQKDGKVDPVRAQAARLRLVLAGKEKALLPAVEESPGSVLALLDAWNRAPWAVRAEVHTSMLMNPVLQGSDVVVNKPTYEALGIRTQLLEEGMNPPPAPMNPRFFPVSRLFEGLGKPAPAEAWNAVKFAITSKRSPQGWLLQTRLSAISALPLFDNEDAKHLAESLAKDRNPLVLATDLATLRDLSPSAADDLRTRLLCHPNPIARAAAIADLPAAPADLDALTQRCWGDGDFDAQQALIQSYARWKLPVETQEAQLRRWLTHPDWACRYEAYQALKKLDLATPWPAAPKPTPTDRAILAEAVHLAERGKPVRLRITFSGNRRVTLRLDPTVAPMNVANLVLLARKHFFDGHLVPRVVPDFVVQMGSPCDTMDGGPGYTVRCEDSTHWYGPGSVGMALAGKDTGGSQFFITTNATPHLTGRYTWLGRVESPGHDLKVLDGLELGATIERVAILP